MDAEESLYTFTRRTAGQYLGNSNFKQRMSLQGVFDEAMTHMEVIKFLFLILLCQVSELPERWIPAFVGMTTHMGIVTRVIPAKAGIHFAQYLVT